MKVYEKGMSFGSLKNGKGIKPPIIILTHCDSSGQRGKSCQSGGPSTPGV